MIFIVFNKQFFLIFKKKTFSLQMILNFLSCNKDDNKVIKSFLLRALTHRLFSIDQFQLIASK